METASVAAMLDNAVACKRILRTAGALLAIGGFGVLIPAILQAVGLAHNVTNMPFEQIKGGCRITELVSSDLRTWTGPNGGQGCEVKFTYMFCTPSSCGHRSIAGLNLFHWSKFESTCDKASLPFAVNQTTTCWQPKQGEKIHQEIWPCGNPECYRIFEPGEQGGSKEHKEFMMPMLTFLGIAIALCCSGCYVMCSGFGWFEDWFKEDTKAPEPALEAPETSV